MLTQSKSKKTEVVISKGNTPKESLLKGIDILGGISKFIDEGDHVFIKFNLHLPGGFPTNTNLDTLQTIIISCKKAGAKKVYLGSFPFKGVSIKSISDLLCLNEFFQSNGAELAFLDNSDIFENKEINQDQLKKIKYNSLTNIQIKNNEFLVPNVILNSDKVICVNQINVDPLFKLNLSLYNLYSIIPTKYQEIGKKSRDTNDYISRDQYKRDLISNIFDIFTIKKPNLVINDLYYILEGAGPHIYKDSELKKTGLMILGNDAISVDVVTLNALNLDFNENELIQQAYSKNIIIPKISTIRILGEKLEDIKTNVKLCVSKIDDIRARNVSINSGKYCSGCFKQAYHLLNIMKTYMGKDLKYNIDNSFIVGENPPEPEKVGNFILFGDCAINSTKDYSFKKIITEQKKDIIGETKQKFKKELKFKKKTKVKEKPNKNILDLPGCPPDISNCLELILKYYKKKNVPNLNLLRNVNKLWITGESINKLKIWEAL